ncbi:MAG: hypothetical protein GY705_26770 [Bacteroidetes bacterium]|nr:hypothetical protein [Bacteroidota bacterium]
MKLPEHLADRAKQFPEYSYGANKVTLILQNGIEIKEVFLAWGEEIVKIGSKPIESKKELPFSIEEIKDLISEA